MPRIARVVAEGYPHHIIQRGNNRQNVFFDSEDRVFYLELLKKYSKECGNSVHAYCLMENHVHMLLTPERQDSLAKAMQKLSLRFTQHINRKFNRTGRLWECRYFSAIVDKETYLWSVLRYIEKNPVRAKLVERPAQYKWSSANNPYKKEIVTPILDEHEQQEYINFLNKPEDEIQIQLIRNKTYSGKPIGSTVFVNHIEKILERDLDTRPKGRPRKEIND
jgi:putative transposase